MQDKVKELKERFGELSKKLALKVIENELKANEKGETTFSTHNDRFFTFFNDYMASETDRERNCCIFHFESVLRELINGPFGIMEIADKVDFDTMQLKEPIRFKHYTFNCKDCGEKLEVEISKDGVRYTDDLGCKYNPIYNVEIEVPTGKLMFFDWPRAKRHSDAIPDLDELAYELDSHRKMQLETICCAKHNVLCVEVGNTSPNIYQKGNTILAEQFEYEEYTDENGDVFEDASPYIKEGYEKKGYVCTDVWQVTAMDEVVYKELFDDIDEAEDCCVRLEVEPGTYEIEIDTSVCVKDFFPEENNPRIDKSTRPYFIMKRKGE